MYSGFVRYVLCIFFLQYADSLFIFLKMSFDEEKCLILMTLTVFLLLLVLGVLIFI